MNFTLEAPVIGHTAPVKAIVRPRRAVTLSRVCEAVCEFYGLNSAALKGDGRHRSVAWPRQMAMALADELTAWGLSDIGRWLHRDHTTVIHALKAVAERRERFTEIDDEYHELRERLG